MINISKLGYSYAKKIDALKGVDITISEGEFVAVAGPNGAGKSTLLKVLAGILRGYSGSVSVRDKEVKDCKNPEFSKQVSYIPQSDGIAFDFNVYDIVAMGRRPYINGFGTLHEADMEMIENGMELLGIAGLKKRMFSTLSGGEKRMVLLARAFVQDAGIMLLDEPVTYLDIHHIEELMSALSELNKNGKTIIMVVHDINIASEYAKRTIFLRGGEKVLDGDAGEVVNENNIKAVYGTKNVKVIVNPETKNPNVVLTNTVNGER